MTSELNVLTVNLWGFPWPVARERLERKRRLAAHLAARPYDLVGIQELWWPWRRSLALASLVLPPGRRDSGLALAGRLAIREEARVEHFRHHRGLDRLKRKGFLRAGVETPSGAALCVCVTHLQAGRRHASVRARQIAQLLDHLAGDLRPVVLMGDFNLHEEIDEDRLSAEALGSAGFEDAALSLARHEPTYTSSNPYVRHRLASDRLDRVYLRGARGLRLRPLEVEVVQVDPRPVSDHHPVRVRVRVSEE